MCVCVNLHTHIYHIFFIHSSVDWTLDCFHILAIVNNAAVHIGVHASFQISVFIFFRYSKECYCWVIWWVYFSCFKDPPCCFPEWLHQLTHPPTVYKCFLFSTFYFMYYLASNCSFSCFCLLTLILAFYWLIHCLYYLYLPILICSETLQKFVTWF